MLFSISLMTKLSTYEHKPAACVHIHYTAANLGIVSSTRREVYTPEKEYSLCFWLALQSVSSSCHSFGASSVCRVGIPSVSGCMVELHKPVCDTPFYFLAHAILAMLKLYLKGFSLHVVQLYLLCNLQFPPLLVCILFY